MFKTALIIQEDLILLRILERLMRIHGYSCRSIRTLAELNIEDQERVYDLIVSDILYEGIAPYDFIFQIGEILKHKSLIVVTNMGQENVREQISKSRSVAGFFSIPFDPDDIKKLIA